MRMRTCLPSLILVAAMPHGLALASQPGQPLALDDFVVQPGFTVELLAGLSEPDCDGSLPVKKCFGVTGNKADAVGNTYRSIGTWSWCGVSQSCNELTLMQYNQDGTSTAVFTLADRLADANHVDAFEGFDVWIDPFNGIGYLHLRTVSVSYTSGSPLYPPGTQLFAIRGLPTLSEVLVTYMPHSALRVQMPRLPEGLRSADSLQVWTGDVRSMPDWSQAQPLACQAAESPVPGQIVNVPDTLAAPAVGHARYYLTASLNGADRRLGRQYVNGAFSARNPTTLPACAP